MKTFDIEGVIVSNDDVWIYDWYDMTNTSPQKVKNFLDEANGEDVIININSGGGDFYAGVNIHDTIKAYPGNVELRVVGLAASAASIIAMASKCLISPASNIMIHNVACTDYSNKNGKRKCADDMAVTDNGLAFLYSQKTGLPENEISRMMDEETFLDAKTALEKGFVDGILGNEIVDTPKFNNSLAMVHLLPNEVLDKTRQLIVNDMKQRNQNNKNNANKPVGTSVESLYKRLNLLRRVF